MGRITRRPSFLIWGLFLFLSSMPCSPSLALDAISPGRPLSGNQTVASKDGIFELGFFSPGNSHSYYVGIWYKQIPVQTVVWIANRESPLTETSSSEFKISDDGNLAVINHLKIQVWSSNSTHPSPSSSTAVLLDNGNLILTDKSNSSAVIWQSFDHPTDTWLPGSWLGLNRVTGENQYITSWRNLENPSPGFFSFRLDETGPNEYFLVWNKTRRYWRTGAWNGKFFSLLPEMGAFPSFSFTFVDNEKGRFGSFPANPSIYGRGRVDSSGQFKWWIWVNSSQKWLMIWAAPSSHCAVHSLWGSFSVCDEKSSLFCRCLRGFEPASRREWELDDWSGGCVRRTRLQCGNITSMDGIADGFLTMNDVKLADDNKTLGSVQNATDCESACLRSCDCTAYSFHGGCLIWTGELLNLQQLSEDAAKGTVLFLRLAASELTSSNSKKNRVTKVIVGAAAGVLVLLFCVALGVAAWYRRRRRARNKALVPPGPLVQFSYSDLRSMTRNFSQTLGKGGFGTVYKGILPDSSPVAVKRLQGQRQGEKQFRNELRTLGTVQHVNLVLLRGFCTKGSERMLVYDYMPNGSLDSYLFEGNSGIVGWKKRFQVMLGVARGLAYLHESCREQIVHCDIKPENILLDEDFCPKVADFGMAKLYGRELSRVLTTMRGTVGYLAPEWIAGLAITAKADVYSYGMMLFEVISGRRNAELSPDGEPSFFPVRATTMVHEGNVLGVSDEKLEGSVDMEELRTACRLACWCIQDSEVHRPSMSQVVKILEGSMEVGVPPVPSSLQRFQ